MSGKPTRSNVVDFHVAWQEMYKLEPGWRFTVSSTLVVEPASG